MAVVKSVTSADIYKTKLSGSAHLNDNLSTPEDKKDLKSSEDAPAKAKSGVKTRAQYQAETLAKMAPQEEEPVVKKKVKKKIKLSKTEKKTKAKKERREAFDNAKPKHQARKNKNKGKPKRVKQAELDSATTDAAPTTKSVYKKLTKRTDKNKDVKK